MHPSNCNSQTLSHGVKRQALSHLSSLPQQPYKDRTSIVPICKRRKRRPREHSGSACHTALSGRVGIQVEEVWLQSLGSEPQTQQKFLNGSSCLFVILTDMFLFSNSNFTCWLRVT